MDENMETAVETETGSQTEDVAQDTELKQEQTVEEQPPKLSLSELLASDGDYQAQYSSMVEEYKAEWQAETQKRLDSQRIEFELSAALEKAGARNQKAVKALLDMEKISVKDGVVSGIKEQLTAVMQSDSYLFQNNAGRPYFSTGSSGGNPGSSDDAIVEGRYRNNPWYHG